MTFFSSLFDRSQPTSFFGGPLWLAGGPEPDPPRATTGESEAPAAGAQDHLSYLNGTPVIDPNTAQPYPRPPKLDVPANITLGTSIAPYALWNSPEGAVADLRDPYMAGWFIHGGPMDYQRPHGYFAALRGGPINGFRNVTNYNFGAVAAAAGYTLGNALDAAGLYNRTLGIRHENDTAYGIQPESVKTITQGWQDMRDGKWTR